MSNENCQSRYGIAWQAGIATLCRLVLNTGRRFAYPFAPVLSRGLGVPLTAVTPLIAANQATSVLGMFAGGLLPFFSVVLAALVLGGLGKTVFDPVLQTYIGERVPFNQRGMVTGILEFSWAGSTLVAIPLLALLIERFGWQAPFFVLGGFGILGILVLMRVIPTNRSLKSEYSDAVTFRRAWTGLRHKKASWGMMGYAFLFSAANDNLFVVF